MSAPSSCTARRWRPTVPVSLATVYNTLHQFVGAGLLREVVVSAGRSYFDTNVSDHHHFFYEDIGPSARYSGRQHQCRQPAGAARRTSIRRVDVIIRVDPSQKPPAPRR